MAFNRDFEHKDALLEAATEEFTARGYDRASLNRILGAAGMSKGQFYHHFRNKEELYMGVVAHLIALKQAYFEAHPVPEGADFFGTLRAQLSAGLAFAREHPEIDAFSRSFLRERGNPIFGRTLDRFAFDEQTALGRMVARAHQAGAFASGVGVELAQRLVGMVFSKAPELLDADSPEEMEGRLEQLVRFLERGLRS